jgi:hypothetical protein
MAWLVARAARPAEPRVVSAFGRAGDPFTGRPEGTASWLFKATKRSDSDKSLERRKAEMTLGSAGLAARATSTKITQYP